MKRKLLTLLLASTLVLSPTTAFADEKDDRIVELEGQVAELQQTIDDLQKQLDDALASTQSTTQDTYKIGETYVVEGLWKITINSVEETADRNNFSDKNPAAVYVVTYTYENLGYDNDYSDGLYIYLEDGIVDSTGKMGYSYPGDVSKYPQGTPIGAFCEAQTCIGVDNPGNFKINFSEYGSDFNKYSAVFELEV